MKPDRGDRSPWFADLFGRALSIARRWAAWAALVVFGAGLFIHVLNVPVPGATWPWLASMGMIVAIAIYDLAIANAKRIVEIEGDLKVGIERLSEVEREVAAIRQAGDSIARGIDKLSGGSLPKLRTLEECQKDLQAVLLPFTGRKKTVIVVDHLGLDMKEAWRYMRRLLLNKSVTNVEYRGLVVGEPREAAAWPQEAIGWCASARQTMEEIRNDLEKTLPDLERSGGRFTFELRRYRELPTIHGFALRKPTPILYFAFCRWVRRHTGWRYDWGYNSYMKVATSGPDPVSLNLGRIFDNQFEHLWDTADPIEGLAGRG